MRPIPELDWALCCPHIERARTRAGENIEYMDYGSLLCVMRCGDVFPSYRLRVKAFTRRDLYAGCRASLEPSGAICLSFAIKRGHEGYLFGFSLRDDSLQ